MKHKNLFVGTIATAIGIVILLGLVEVGLHLFNYPASPLIGWKWDRSPYRAEINKDDLQVNQLGLRGREIVYDKDDFVVVLLGDSQVEAGTQPANLIPEIVLEAALKNKLSAQKIRVVSIAAAGWGQDQQLVALQQYFKRFRADLVLHWPTPVNDYWENTFVDRSITKIAGPLKPSFQLVDGKLGTGLPQRFESKLSSLWKLARGRSSGDKQYTLEQAYKDDWQKQLPTSNNQVTPASQCPATEVLEKDLLESFMQGSRAYTLVTDEDIENGRSHFNPFLKNMSARDHSSVAITHALIKEIATLSRKNQAQFFLFHPYRSDLDAAFREIRCVKSLNSSQHYEFAGADWPVFMKQAEFNAQLITLDVKSEHALNVAKGDWHLSAEGNQLVMTALVDALVQRRVFADGLK